jgi:hypothetical protein
MVKQQKIVLLAAGFAGALIAAILLVGTVAEVGRAGRTRTAGIRARRRPGGLGLFGPAAAGSRPRTSPTTQKDEVKAIVDSHRVEMRGLLDRQAQARRALAASAESGQVDDAAANEVGAASAALALAEARMRAEVFQLLDARAEGGGPKRARNARSASLAGAATSNRTRARVV